MSQKVDWKTAKDMLTAYQNNSNALKQTPGGCEVNRGFLFDKSDVQELLDLEATTQVLIMPAVKYDDLNKPEAEQTFTVMLAGLDSNGDILTAYVYDFANDVPPNLPSNYPYVQTC
ncbi:MAG: hypothetical protein ACWA41_02285 [Putridiphycobacter sp.]